MPHFLNTEHPLPVLRDTSPRLLPKIDVSTGQEQFYKQKWESIRAAQASGRLGKKTPTTQCVFFISICSLSDHYHHISSLSLHIRRFCFRFAKPLPLSLLVESFGQDYPIIPKWPSKTVQHCAAMQNCEVLVRGNECPAEGEGPQFGMEQKPWITRWWNLCRPH